MSKMIVDTKRLMIVNKTKYQVIGKLVLPSSMSDETSVPVVVFRLGHSN